MQIMHRHRLRQFLRRRRWSSCGCRAGSKRGQGMTWRVSLYLSWLVSKRIGWRRRVLTWGALSGGPRARIRSVASSGGPVIAYVLVQWLSW